MKLINEKAYKILIELREMPVGFNELVKKRHFTPHTLAVYLRELKRMGFVKRKVRRTAPIRVTYQLTLEGCRITDMLYDLCAEFKLRID